MPCTIHGKAYFWISRWRSLIPSLASARVELPAGIHPTWCWAESKALGLSVVPSLQSSSGNKPFSCTVRDELFTSFAANIFCRTTRLFTVTTLDFCPPSHLFMLLTYRGIPAGNHSLLYHWPDIVISSQAVMLS